MKGLKINEEDQLAHISKIIGKLGACCSRNSEKDLVIVREDILCSICGSALYLQQCRRCTKCMSNVCSKCERTPSFLGRILVQFELKLDGCFLRVKFRHIMTRTQIWLKNIFDKTLFCYTNGKFLKITARAPRVYLQEAQGIIDINIADIPNATYVAQLVSWNPFQEREEIFSEKKFEFHESELVGEPSIAPESTCESSFHNSPPFIIRDQQRNLVADGISESSSNVEIRGDTSKEDFPISPLKTFRKRKQRLIKRKQNSRVEQTSRAETSEGFETLPSNVYHDYPSELSASVPSAFRSQDASRNLMPTEVRNRGRGKSLKKRGRGTNLKSRGRGKFQKRGRGTNLKSSSFSNRGRSKPPMGQNSSRLQLKKKELIDDKSVVSRISAVSTNGRGNNLEDTMTTPVRYCKFTGRQKVQAGPGFGKKKRKKKLTKQDKYRELLQKVIDVVSRENNKGWTSVQRIRQRAIAVSPFNFSESLFSNTLKELYCAGIFQLKKGYLKYSDLKIRLNKKEYCDYETYIQEKLGPNEYKSTHHRGLCIGCVEKIQRKDEHGQTLTYYEAKQDDRIFDVHYATEREACEKIEKQFVAGRLTGTDVSNMEIIKTMIRNTPNLIFWNANLAVTATKKSKATILFGVLDIGEMKRLFGAASLEEIAELCPPDWEAVKNKARRALKMIEILKKAHHGIITFQDRRHVFILLGNDNMRKMEKFRYAKVSESLPSLLDLVKIEGGIVILLKHSSLDDYEKKLAPTDMIYDKSKNFSVQTDHCFPN